MNDLCASCGGQCCRFVSLSLGEVKRGDMEWLQVRGTLFPDGRWVLESPCPKFDSETGKCRIYARRPRACKLYPVDGPSCRLIRKLAV